MKKLILIGVLSIFFLKYCTYYFFKEKPYQCFDFGDISKIMGDWQYSNEKIKYIDPSSVFYRFLNLSSYVLPIYDQISCDISKYNYRIRIFEDGTLQAYNFLGAENNFLEYEFDSSDYFSYVPLVKSKGKYPYVSKNTAVINTYYSDKIFTFSGMGDSVVMRLIRNSKNPDVDVAIFETTECNDPIIFPAKKVVREPSSNNAIVFLDELNKVKLEDVKVLSIAGFNLKEIPQIVGECKNLTKLFASFNNIKFTRSDIEILASLQNLKLLDIRFNNIAASDDPTLNGLKRLKSLKKIYIGGKNFSNDGSIPKVFTQMPNLKLLSISFVCLDNSTFPEEYKNDSIPFCINIAHSRIIGSIDEKIFRKSYFLDVDYQIGDSEETLLNGNFNLEREILYGRRYKKRHLYQRDMD